MSRCTYHGEILQEHVSLQPLNTQRISRSEGKGQMCFERFFGVRDAAATRVQYLALSNQNKPKSTVPLIKQLSNRNCAMQDKRKQYSQ